MLKITTCLKPFNLSLSRAGFILLLLQTQWLLAEPINNKDFGSSWTLWAKPRICVLPSDHLSCKMETDIGWLGAEKDNICLLSSQEKAVLQCWDNASSGQLVQQINTDKQIVYWLTREGESKVLVKTTIRIVSFPQKRVRRRRRHIWSLL